MVHLPHARARAAPLPAVAAVPRVIECGAFFFLHSCYTRLASYFMNRGERGLLKRCRAAGPRDGDLISAKGKAGREIARARPKAARKNREQADVRCVCHLPPGMARLVGI